MAKTRRKYKGSAVQATIAGGLTAGTVSAVISSATGWPTSGPFYAVIDPGLSSEEKVLIGAISGTTISSITRGVDDTSDQTHTAGCTIYPVFTAIDADEANELTSSYAHQGAMVYQGASTFAELQIGTAGQVIKVNAGATAPEWGQVPTAGIADESVTSAKIASSVAGNGLSGGAGTALSVNVDGSTIEISSDSLRLKDSGVTLAKLASAVANSLVPVGTIAMYGGAAAPTGWLLCDGSAINASYTALKAIVGANTPDLRGRFAIGDNSTLTLLGTGGSATISTSNLPSHNHSFSATTGGMSQNSSLSHSVNDPGHAHTINDTGINFVDGNGDNGFVVAGAVIDDQGGLRGMQAATTGISISSHDVSHTHSVSGTTGSTGSGTDYYPPYAVVNYIIKHD